MPNQTMYAQNIYFPDAFKGCKHDCVYCKPSFQRQAKRQKQRCNKCYTFEPHFHQERTLVDLHQQIAGKKVYDYRKTPATKGEQFVFFPKGGDLAFAEPDDLEELLDFIDNNPQTQFLIQTKNPKFMLDPHNQQFMHDNVIFGITLETDKGVFAHTPSMFKDYTQISKAPLPYIRAADFAKVKFGRKFVTIEPILQFDLAVLTYWIHVIAPKVVYIGYDTKGCKLPEPTLEETQKLIEALKASGVEVRLKTIRKAWYEPRTSKVQQTFSQEEKGKKQ